MFWNTKNFEYGDVTPRQSSFLIRAIRDPFGARIRSTAIFGFHCLQDTPAFVLQAAGFPDRRAEGRTGYGLSAETQWLARREWSEGA